MKQNIYDDERFFNKYSGMARSMQGLQAAGEWHEFQALLPQMQGQHVLDLGCGFGWHCRYVAEQGAQSVIGVDISEKMLAKAKAETDDPAIRYIRMPIEDISFPKDQFDTVISSLAFHYIAPLDQVFRQIYHCLKPGGAFVFSVEHPIFTAEGKQEWYVDQLGKRLHWPVDRYQDEGMRESIFLEEQVVKYHRTIATYMNELLASGFRIVEVREPVPSPEMLQSADMVDELRRPMFLLLSFVK